MQLAEFTKRTGWNSRRAARAVDAGWLSSFGPIGSGYRREYTALDVLIARATDEVRATLMTTDQGTTAQRQRHTLDAVALALRILPDLRGWLVLSLEPTSQQWRPTVLSDVEATANFIEANPGRNHIVLHLAALT